jgi:acyl homoserine lactone synthase
MGVHRESGLADSRARLTDWQSLRGLRSGTAFLSSNTNDYLWRFVGSPSTGSPVKCHQRLKADMNTTHHVGTHTLQDLCPADRHGMFRLRYDTFHTRLGWDVKTTDDLLEIDEFDALERAHYIVATAPGEHVDACWRLLPTQGPNMLRDVFPELLHGQPAPNAADVWELSRFAIASSNSGRVGDADAVNPQLGFGELSVALMKAALHFARENGIARYVTVTTTALERMLKRQGLSIHRLGPPIRIGSVMTVACFIEVDDITAKALNE